MQCINYKLYIHGKCSLHSCQIQTLYMKFKWWVLPIGMVRCTMRVLRYAGEYFLNARSNYIIQSSNLNLTLIRHGFQNLGLSLTNLLKSNSNLPVFTPIKLSSVDLSSPAHIAVSHPIDLVFSKHCNTYPH